MNIDSQIRSSARLPLAILCSLAAGCASASNSDPGNTKSPDSQLAVEAEENAVSPLKKNAPFEVPRQDVNMKEDLRPRDPGFLMRQAQGFTQNREFEKAAAIYDTLSKENKESLGPSGMCEVLFNLAFNLEKIGRVEQMIAARETMVGQYPQCRHKCQALHFLVSNFIDNHQVDKGVALRNKITSDYPECPSAQEVR